MAEEAACRPITAWDDAPHLQDETTLLRNMEEFSMEMSFLDNKKKQFGAVREARDREFLESATKLTSTVTQQEFLKRQLETRAKEMQLELLAAQQSLMEADKIQQALEQQRAVERAKEEEYERMLVANICKLEEQEKLLKYSEKHQLMQRAACINKERATLRNEHLNLAKQRANWMNSQCMSEAEIRKREEELAMLEERNQTHLARTQKRRELVSEYFETIEAPQPRHRHQTPSDERRPKRQTRTTETRTTLHPSHSHHHNLNRSHHHHGHHAHHVLSPSRSVADSLHVSRPKSPTTPQRASLMRSPTVTSPLAEQFLSPTRQRLTMSGDEVPIMFHQQQYHDFGRNHQYDHEFVRSHSPPNLRQPASPTPLSGKPAKWARKVSPRRLQNPFSPNNANANSESFTLAHTDEQPLNLTYARLLTETPLSSGSGRTYEAEERTRALEQRVMKLETENEKLKAMVVKPKREKTRDRDMPTRPRERSLPPSVRNAAERDRTATRSREYRDAQVERDRENTKRGVHREWAEREREWSQFDDRVRRNSRDENWDGNEEAEREASGSKSRDPGRSSGRDHDRSYNKENEDAWERERLARSSQKPTGLSRSKSSSSVSTRRREVAVEEPSASSQEDRRTSDSWKATTTRRERDRDVPITRSATTHSSLNHSIDLRDASALLKKALKMEEEGVTSPAGKGSLSVGPSSNGSCTTSLSSNNANQRCPFRELLENYGTAFNLPGKEPLTPLSSDQSVHE